MLQTSTNYIHDADALDLDHYMKIISSIILL